MKKKLLSVIAAAALSVTTFAAFTVTAMAATCPNCGSGNVYADYAQTVNANCIWGGEIMFFCSECYSDWSEPGPTNPQNHVDLQSNVIEEATCTAAGNRHYICGGCGVEYDEPIPAKGHNLQNGICTRCAPDRFTYHCAGDYTSETPTDNVASLWELTLSPLDNETIESLNVKVNGHAAAEGDLETPVITGGTVVAGIVVNHASTDINNVTAVVNDTDIAATKID